MGDRSGWEMAFVLLVRSVASDPKNFLKSGDRSPIFPFNKLDGLYNHLPVIPWLNVLNRAFGNTRDR